MPRKITDADKLWGETGPYSQAQLIIETRILDDRVSRIFVLVELQINPYTYELIKNHRNKFKDDPSIQQIIDTSEYRGQADGYVSCLFSDEFNDHAVLERANEALKQGELVIVKMHKYVLQHLKVSKMN